MRARCRVNEPPNHSEATQASWWALQYSNLRPLPCEPAQGSRQTYTSLIKSSQSLKTTKPPSSDLRHDLAPFFRRLGPNWGPILELKAFCRRGFPRTAAFRARSGQAPRRKHGDGLPLCEQGELPHVRVSHTIRLRSIDVAEFVEAHRTRSPPGSRVALPRRSSLEPLTREGSES